jgi:hypothetical protein
VSSPSTTSAAHEWQGTEPNFEGVCGWRTNRSRWGTRNPGPFYHGTTADLKAGPAGTWLQFQLRRAKEGELRLPDRNPGCGHLGSGTGDRRGTGRIYRVEPTGLLEDDPNLTDKRFPGNPTRSYRAREPLRVVGEVLDWEGHAPAVLQDMREHLEKLERLGIEAIND